jgi:hypothetical protein
MSRHFVEAPAFVSLPGERWRALIEFGFDGYEVSNKGRVRSFRIGGRSIKRRVNPIPRKLYPVDKHGIIYLGLMFCIDGHALHRWAHLLVLSSFRGARPEGKVARHLDGDSINNDLRNLRWGTPIENEKDKFRHGTHQYGENNPSAKLTNAQADIIRQSNESAKILAARFGVSDGAVYRIRSGARRPQLVGL